MYCCTAARRPSRNAWLQRGASSPADALPLPPPGLPVPEPLLALAAAAAASSAEGCGGAGWMMARLPPLSAAGRSAYSPVSGSRLPRNQSLSCRGGGMDEV